MAKPRSDAGSKRHNRTVGLSEALSGALAPMLKRRGFASRDIINHWAAIAPSPYDAVTRPDKLTWPRGVKGAEGAILYLRCHPGHALALAHEGERIAASINRYFGYVLVAQVHMSLEPFAPAAAALPETAPALSDVIRARISRTVEPVGDPAMRDALKRLGQAIAARKRS